MPGHDVRDVEEVERPAQSERRERRTIHPAAAPERRDPKKCEQVDRGARHEAEGAIEEQAGDPTLRRVIQDLLLIAYEEVARARDEPAEQPPVEIAEQEDERGEWKRRADEAANDIATRPERRVRDDHAEPDRDEPRARREPRQRSHERAGEDKIAQGRCGAAAD